jgi:hypothetical protein
MSRERRTAGPNSPGCPIVWFAPTPRSCGGRSAVIAIIGMPAWSASTIAGCRLTAAVPEVVTTMAGTPVTLAIPIAR